jgi:hypothetical protein
MIAGSVTSVHVPSRSRAIRWETPRAARSSSRVGRLGTNAGSRRSRATQQGGADNDVTIAAGLARDADQRGLSAHARKYVGMMLMACRVLQRARRSGARAGWRAPTSVNLPLMLLETWLVPATRGRTWYSRLLMAGAGRLEPATQAAPAIVNTRERVVRSQTGVSSAARTHRRRALCRAAAATSVRAARRHWPPRSPSRWQEC